MRGKKWSVEEERDLKKLVSEGHPVEVIAVRFRKRPKAVQVKIDRLGLVVDVDRKMRSTTSEPKIAIDLPTIEDQLRRLARAVDALDHSGLSREEVFRLNSVVHSVEAGWNNII